MCEDVRFRARFATDVEGGGGDVAEFDVDEEAGRGEALAVDVGDFIGEVVFLGGG